MALLKDNVLHSLDTSLPPITLTEVSNKSLVDILLEHLQLELAEKGDRVYSKEADDGFGSIHLIKERNLSEIIPVSASIANALISRGFKKGDVVQLSMHHNTDFFLVAFGVWMAGGVLSLSDPTLSVKVVSQQLRSAKARFVFCTADVLDRVIDAAKDHELVDIVVVNSKHDSDSKAVSMEDFLRGQEGKAIPSAHKERSYKDLASIFWSSGTTGDPKGIPWSHRSIVHGLTNPFWGSYTNRTYIISTAMFHLYGFILHVSNAFCRGVSIVFISFKHEISMRRLFDACHTFRPVALSVGFHYGLQMAQGQLPEGLNLDSVELIIPIGGPLCEDIIFKLKRKFKNSKILNAYGMSEVGGVGMAHTYANLGALVRGIKVKIVDVETRQLLGPNQLGEICTSSEMMMEGYINVAEKDKGKEFTEDGFLYSGDLGYYDEHGQLYYKDRIKSLIKYHNRHVYPKELEDLIHKIPGVVEVGVLSLPDKDLQEMITAVVVKAPGATVTEKDILESVNDQLEDYKRIRGGVHFVDAIPRNTMGKVLRYKLKDFFSDS